MAIIRTPKPPLNIMGSDRLAVSDAWQTILEVPTYQIPADGPGDTDEDVLAVAILQKLHVFNDSGAAAKISVRVVDTVPANWLLVFEQDVADGATAVVEIEKQNLLSEEELQIKMDTGKTGVAHLSYVLNQRESYTVVA